MLYRLLAKLLDYPNTELIEALAETRSRLTGLEPSERQAVADFIGHIESRPLTDAQAAYVLTFDLTPANSLHLTHHLFGDDKNRGPALIDLAEFYKEYGLELAANELPDYLPLMLEFADQLEPEEARMFLSQWSKVLRQLAGNLEQISSPYAPLVRLVERNSALIKAAA